MFYSDSDGEEISNAKARPSFSMGAQGGDIAGLRRKRTPLNPALSQTGMGSWEVHTRGIGAKILLQMGFEPGKGLGKKLQGISAPVEAHLRKGRGAIGAYGPEKLAKVPEKKIDEDEEEAKEFKVKLSQWRKGDGVGGGKRKVRYHYRSVDQVLEDGKTRPNRKAPIISQISRVKVIDMTGPEQRVLSGYHAIAGGQKRPDDSHTVVDKKLSGNFSLPELQHNLNLLVDMCEQDIVRNDRRTRNLNDRVVALENEGKNITKVVDQHEQLIETLQSVLSIVDKLADQNDEMTLRETAESFRRLQTKHYEEYKIYELGELASSFVAPKVKEHLANWNPLAQPKQPMSLMKEWKDILDTGTSTLQSRGMQPYDQLVWNAWMPSIRGAVQ